MVKNSYLLYNGVLMARESWKQEADELVLSFGQGIRTDFFASGNRIPFLMAQLELLKKRFLSVGWVLPGELEYQELKTRFERLLNKNRLFKGSLIRLLVLPVPGSREMDGNPVFSYLASTEELDHDYFPLNAKGLSIGISTQYKNTGEPLYSSMVRSLLRTLLIRQEAARYGWDDILLLDYKDHVSEASESNVFIRTNDQVITPAPGNNCLPRVVAHLLPEWIVEEGYRFSEMPTIRPEDLQQADEVFLVSDLQGIRWVLSFETKRYYRKLSVLLSDKLASRMRNLDQFHIGSSG